MLRHFICICSSFVIMFNVFFSYGWAEATDAKKPTVKKKINSEVLKIKSMENKKMLADNHHIAQAFDLYQQDNLDSAIKLLENKNNINYDNENYMLLLIRLLLLNGQQGEAKKITSVVLNLHPSFYHVRLLKAKILISQHENHQALSLLLAKHPAVQLFSSYYNAIAYIYLLQKKYQAAIKQYLIILKYHNDFGPAWLGLAISYQQKKAYDNALSAYQSAMATNQLSLSIQQYVINRLDDLSSLAGV